MRSLLAEFCYFLFNISFKLPRAVKIRKRERELGLFCLLFGLTSITKSLDSFVLRKPRKVVMLVKLLTAKCKRAIQDSLTFTLPKVRVKVNQGRILGVIEKLPDGKAFHRFSGIPYAIPPINELRFRSPQKLLKFDREEVDCRRERDASFHKSGFHRKYVGSEDCLNLNLYVPSSAASDNKLPVMVFIHGGGMVFDSNSRDL